MAQRRRTLAWLLLLTLWLSGCWSRIELNDLGIVTEVGLDRLEDGQIRLAAGIVVPGRVPTPGGQGAARPFAESPVVVMTGTGRDIMECWSELQYKVPRRLYWGHLQAIVLGEELARDGIGPFMDFWTRHRRPRLSGYVVAVRGEALEFLAAKPILRRLPGDALKEILRSPVGMEFALMDVARALSSGGLKDAILPAFSTGHAHVREGGTTSEYVLTGMALFRRDKLVGWLNQEEMRNLLWLRGQVRQGLVTLDPGEPGRISLDVYHADSQVQARLVGSRLVVRVRAEVEADLTESTTRLDLSRPEALRSLEVLAAKELEQRLQGLFAQVVRELKIDPIGALLRLARTDPAGWARVAGRREALLSDAKLEVESNVFIRRTGRHGAPLHVPREEAIQP